MSERDSQQEDGTPLQSRSIRLLLQNPKMQRPRTRRGPRQLNPSIPRRELA